MPSRAVKRPEPEQLVLFDMPARSLAPEPAASPVARKAVAQSEPAHPAVSDIVRDFTADDDEADIWFRRLATAFAGADPVEGFLPMAETAVRA